MFKSLFILLSIVSAAAAFAPVATPNSIKLQLHESTLDEQFPTTIEDSSDTLALSRRNAMFKGSALLLSAIAVSTSPNAAYADIYDDQEKERKLKAKESADKNKKLVPLIGFGGVALSVPFFLPNLIRLFKKVGSGGEDDGYGN